MQDQEVVGPQCEPRSAWSPPSLQGQGLSQRRMKRARHRGTWEELQMNPSRGNCWGQNCVTGQRTSGAARNGQICDI